MRVVWTEPAVEDLEGIKQYIQRDSAFYAARVVERVIDRVERLAGLPRCGRVVPEAGREDIREVYCYDYRVIYRVKDDRITVLTVVHGSRDLGRLGSPPWA